MSKGRVKEEWSLVDKPWPKRDKKKPQSKRSTRARIKSDDKENIKKNQEKEDVTKSRSRTRSDDVNEKRHQDAEVVTVDSNQNRRRSLRVRKNSVL